jgi:anti-anti-sigma factor
MDSQAQQPTVGHDAAGAQAEQISEHLRCQSPTTTARPHGQIQQPDAAAAPQTGNVDGNLPCGIRSRGTDLVLAGEIDLHNTGELQAHILTWLHDNDNHLDCTGVDFIDSMGLSMFLHIHAAAVQRGASVHVTCSPTIYTVLEMAGLTNALPGLTITRCEND